jgi:uncharacterized damage-inducible protein DinB
MTDPNHKITFLEGSMQLDQLFSHWDQIHSGTLWVLDLFKDSEMEFQAFEGGWNIGEIALHIANVEEGWFRVVALRESEEWPSAYKLENFPTKTAIKDLLLDTHIITMRYLNTLTINDLDTVFKSEWGDFPLRFIIWHVIEHEIHHRGELSLILGILGREGWGV